MKKHIAGLVLAGATLLALGSAAPAHADGRGVDFTVGIPVSGGYVTATNQNTSTYRYPSYNNERGHEWREHREREHEWRERQERERREREMRERREHEWREHGWHNHHENAGWRH